MNITTKRTTFLQNVAVLFAAMDLSPIDTQGQAIQQQAAHITSLLQRVSDLEAQLAERED